MKKETLVKFAEALSKHNISSAFGKFIYVTNCDKGYGFGVDALFEDRDAGKNPVGFAFCSGGENDVMYVGVERAKVASGMSHMQLRDSVANAAIEAGMHVAVVKEDVTYSIAVSENLIDTGALGGGYALCA